MTNPDRQPRERLDDLLARRPVTRGGFLAGAGLGLAAFLAACGGDSSSGGSAGSSSTAAGPPTTGPAEPFWSQGGELNIYSWPDYFKPEHLKYWEKKTGGKIRVSSYENNEAMFAKLNSAAGAQYDLALPTTGWVPIMAELGIIQELDQSRIPFQHLDPELLGQEFDPSNKYSIPKTFGTSCIVYREELTGPIETWDDYIAVLQKNPGKVSIPEGGKGLLAVGMAHLGYKRNSTNIKEFEEAADYLIKEVAPKAAKFGGTFDTDDIRSGKVIAMTTDSSVARKMLIEDGELSFGLLKPESEIWVDNYVIPKGAKNVEQAYSFLSYLLQPDVQVEETNFHGYASAVVDIADKVDKSFKHPEVVFPTKEQFEYLVPTTVDQEIEGKIQELGEKVKASAA